MPEYAAIIKTMTTHEALPWSVFNARHGAVLSGAPVLATAGTQLWKDLRTRVVEHSVRVIAEYYTRINVPRMCELLELTADECETVVSGLVNAKTIFAKIDRPAGLIVFRAPKVPADVLNDWVSSTK